MTLISKSDEWIELIQLIEEYIEANGDIEIKSEFLEFKSIRRIDEGALRNRESIIKRNKSAKDLERELSNASPEREKLSRQDLALEMVKSLVKTLAEIPLIIKETEDRIQKAGDYDSKITLEWRMEEKDM